jgi:hypothetical protein
VHTSEEGLVSEITRDFAPAVRCPVGRRALAIDELIDRTVSAPPPLPAAAPRRSCTIATPHRRRGGLRLAPSRLDAKRNARARHVERSIDAAVVSCEGQHRGVAKSSVDEARYCNVCG